MPAPDGEREIGAVASPRNLLEASLVALWEELVAIRPLGIDDNFFELGGDSLLVVRLFAEIRKLLGLEMPPETLVQEPTVARLAMVLAAENRTEFLRPSRR